MFEEIRKRVYDGNMALHNLSLVILTWGNASEIDRELGVVAIKPRGIEYSNLVADDIVCVDLSGKVIQGQLLPSVDLDIHLELYRSFPEIGGVSHTHSTYATAYSQAGLAIPLLGTTHADHFYGDIPCVRMPTVEETIGDYERNVGIAIVEHFKEAGIDATKVRAALCEGHGPFTWGSSALEAVEFSLILEEVAKLAQLTTALGGNSKLPQYLVDKHYLRKYGAEKYFYQTKA